MLATVFNQLGSEYLQGKGIGSRYAFVLRPWKKRNMHLLHSRYDKEFPLTNGCIADDNCICIYCEVLLLLLQSLTGNNSLTYASIPSICPQPILVEKAYMFLTMLLQTLLDNLSL